MRPPSIYKCAPLVLHEQGPSHALAHASLPVGNLPVGAIGVDAQVLRHGDKMACQSPRVDVWPLHEDQSSLEVRDLGPGMDFEEHPEYHVFESLGVGLRVC